MKQIIILLIITTFLLSNFYDAAEASYVKQIEEETEYSATFQGTREILIARIITVREPSRTPNIRTAKKRVARIRKARIRTVGRTASVRTAVIKRPTARVQIVRTKPRLRRATRTSRVRERYKVRQPKPGIGIKKKTGKQVL